MFLYVILIFIHLVHAILLVVLYLGMLYVNVMWASIFIFGDIFGDNTSRDLKSSFFGILVGFLLLLVITFIAMIAHRIMTLVEQVRFTKTPCICCC